MYATDLSVFPPKKSEVRKGGAYVGCPPGLNDCPVSPRRRSPSPGGRENWKISVSRKVDGSSNDPLKKKGAPRVEDAGLGKKAAISKIFPPSFIKIDYRRLIRDNGDGINIFQLARIKREINSDGQNPSPPPDSPPAYFFHYFSVYYPIFISSSTRIFYN